MAIPSSSNQYNLFLILVIFFTTISTPVLAQLTVGFYATTCPSVFDTVRTATRAAIGRETRMGASLIRLFFHDCFVNGCDGGVLLVGAQGEQTAPSNQDSIRGMDVIDAIKTQVDTACAGPVVSCADILAIAARDSVVALGGDSYPIPVGRRDARAPNRAGAVSDLPGANEDLAALLGKFSRKGFSPREMVALSGAHTVGQAQCAVYRERINLPDSNIDPAYAASLQPRCPGAGGNDDALAPFDPITPNRFDNSYFQAVIERRTVLRSDQVLLNNGSSTADIVREYNNNPTVFLTDFGNAMLKMGNLSPLTGTQGEIRRDCKVPN